MQYVMFVTAIYTVAACLLSQSSCFLVDDHCPAPPPCTCSSISTPQGPLFYIHCDYKTLSKMPTFSPLQQQYHFYQLRVHFEHNSISYIPEYAFQALTKLSTNHILLFLSDNKISNLNVDAFLGIENTTFVDLELGNNNLTSVPLAVKQIKHIRLLDLTGNPIHSLDSSVLSSIGHSLEVLELDLSLFSEWPRELRLLGKMNYLYLKNTPFTHLNKDAFNGFGQTLVLLEFFGSHLEYFPGAICKLPTLYLLTIDNSPFINDNGSSLFSQCHDQLSDFERLSLTSNNLHSFPDVLRIAPSLTNIRLYNNSLELIESEKVPANNSVGIINLSNNKFKRIPAALNDFSKLTTLYMQHNDIIALESNDFIGLPLLQTLNLNVNPIRYVSNKAFRNNKQLEELYLGDTAMKTIPQAILSPPKLSTIDMSNIFIDCTCDMSFLKHLNASALLSGPMCTFRRVTVKQYITTSLQQCP
ncbi:probable serine/threonine-protein kinase DDB_G0278509 [Mercenaria mercenaria]|uniref:probable serine/threonine-protein kinase DDB_G0278509 n=1 Tax=Mercenaria mercenaria TaxID=6596 RepID=UPI00234F2D66|nr:probable serine/threonine-protein kinase DDB_G0278509 [Mercenaria mercenaria]XP_045161611.2 probable serine/threonine-protein kinase DDB_G0278509 [Mercenaria mercenaria]XP_053378979.1 probable serine/threonine-protein kinase DDB_G0278509 [Mercenaria mercenaria]XP_053378980.1 probable serine/threonine-protein kinase DDB_G0278509 [Mercenaria mercenaria]XP_053378981.1 probable serine/threonine-protein kinase DDB_G0278509 [Mercenaria mercenaria]